MRENLIVGTILKPQGIRGELKVKPYTDSPEDFKEFRNLYHFCAGKIWSSTATKPPNPKRGDTTSSIFWGLPSSPRRGRR